MYRILNRIMILPVQLRKGSPGRSTQVNKTQASPGETHVLEGLMGQLRDNQEGRLAVTRVGGGPDLHFGQSCIPEFTCYVPVYNLCPSCDLRQITPPF